MLRIFKALCRKRGLPGDRFIWGALLCPPVVICCQCGSSRSTRCLSIPFVSSKASPTEGNFPAIHWSSGAQLWLLSSLVDVRHSVDVRTWENRRPTVQKGFHCLACEMTAVLCEERQTDTSFTPGSRRPFLKRPRLNSDPGSVAAAGDEGAGGHILRKAPCGAPVTLSWLEHGGLW